jgi:DNA mismatch endonuclease, patch repair protein
MADTHTKEQRSLNMAAIRSRGNKTTEEALLLLLRKHKISGWRRHQKNIQGTPDFVFPSKRVAIFIDGCYWHGCPRCGLKAKSNQKYWKPKIEMNKKRDRRVNRELRKSGWTVLRIWEHKIKKNPDVVINQIKKELRK